MNTVFKFYNEIWVLLAIAGGSAAGVLVTTFLARAYNAPSFGIRRFPQSIWAPMATFAAAVVLLLASTYPIAATGIRLDARFEPRPNRITLDAYACAPLEPRSKRSDDLTWREPGEVSDLALPTPHRRLLAKIVRGA